MIIKIKHHQKSFVIMDSRPLQNWNLSLRARGLLAYFLSLPENWVVVMSELVKRSKKEGRYSLQAAFKELQASGHATLEQTRNELGQIVGTEWLIHERPKEIPKKICSE